MKEVVIASKNKGKIVEFKQFFAPYQIQVLSMLDMPDVIDDIEETGETFAENAIIKAETLSKLLNKPVLADDSGLEIDALDGRPGVYSARYAGEDKDDQANIKKVLEELSDVPTEERTARFVCVIAIARPGEATFYETGYCYGKIAHTPKGTNGFGYDPIFIPEGYHQTMAELSAEEKNRISHRKHALDQLEAWLVQFSRE